jgi:hypothetical protein
MARICEACRQRALAMRIEVSANSAVGQSGNKPVNCHSPHPAAAPVSFPVLIGGTGRKIQRSPARGNGPRMRTSTSLLPRHRRLNRTFLNHRFLTAARTLPCFALGRYGDGPAGKPVSTANLPIIRGGSPEKSPASQAEQAGPQRSPASQAPQDLRALLVRTARPPCRPRVEIAT